MEFDEYLCDVDFEESLDEPKYIRTTQMKFKVVSAYIFHFS